MGGWGANPPTLFPPFPFAIYDYGIIMIADIPKYSHRTCNRPKCVFPVRHNSELSTTSTLVRSVYYVAKYFVSGPGTKGCPPVIELIPKYHAPPAPLLRAPAEALPRPCLLLRPPRRPPHVTVPRHAGRRSEKLPRTHQGLTQSEKKKESIFASPEQCLDSSDGTRRLANGGHHRPHACWGGKSSSATAIIVPYRF